MIWNSAKRDGTLCIRYLRALDNRPPEIILIRI